MEHLGWCEQGIDCVPLRKFNSKNRKKDAFGSADARFRIAERLLGMICNRFV
jgi:hypothetical protein